HVRAVCRFESDPPVGGSGARRALERSGDGLNKARRCDDRAVPLRPTPQLHGGRPGSHHAPSHSYGMDHRKPGCAGLRDRPFHACSRGGAGAHGQPGVSSRHGTQTSFRARALLKRTVGMGSRTLSLFLAVLLTGTIASARPTAEADPPAFTTVPE